MSVFKPSEQEPRRNVTSVHEHLLKVQTPARECNTVAGYTQFLDSLLTKQTGCEECCHCLRQPGWYGGKQPVTITWGWFLSVDWEALALSWQEGDGP